MLDNKHKVLIGVAAVLLIALGVVGYEFYQQQISNVRAEADAKAQQAIADALRQQITARDAASTKQQAAIVAPARAARTPQQVAEAFPLYVPQVKPEVVAPALPDAPSKQYEAVTGDLVFHAPEAKILLDRVAQCKAQEVEIATCKADLSDQTRITEQTAKQRDDWQRAARGGSFWQRVKHDGKIIGIASIVGAAIGYAAHH